MAEPQPLQKRAVAAFCVPQLVQNLFCAGVGVDTAFRSAPHELQKRALAAFCVLQPGQIFPLVEIIPTACCMGTLIP